MARRSTLRVTRFPSPPSRGDAWERFFDYLERAAPAYSERTIQALKCDLNQFQDWCIAADESALPATPDAVARFALAAGCERRYTTVQRYLCSIAHAHRAIGASDPVNSTAVRLASRTVARNNPAPPAVRHPLREAELKPLLALLGDSLIDCRDRALITVARDTLARRSELCALRVNDVRWGPPREGSTIVIRRAKNDPFGAGRLAWLSPQTHIALATWIERSGIQDGLLFRGILPNGVLTASLSGWSIASRLKRLALLAGRDPSSIGTHSLRVGMTLDLVAGDQSLVAIQIAGGWRSPSMPARYARDLLPELGAVHRWHAGHSGSG